MSGGQAGSECGEGSLEEATSEGGQGRLTEEGTFELNLKREMQPSVPSAGNGLFFQDLERSYPRG